MSKEKTNGQSIALINGMFAIIIAIISLTGGYLLKDPIDKVLFKPHCEVGGVWRPHQDIMAYCEVTKFDEEDEFFIRISSTLTNFNQLIIKGKGIVKGSSGDFEGTVIIYEKGDSKKETSSEKIKGRLGLQGCDGLGVMIEFESGGDKNYSFIRELGNTIGNEKKVK